MKLILNILLIIFLLSLTLSLVFATEQLEEIFFAEGENLNDEFGEYVFIGGDINNDGYDEIAVSSIEYGNDTGKVYIYFGSADFPNNLDSLTITGTETNISFGMSIAFGDVNGDSIDDLMIGEPGQDWKSGKGKVYIYFGSTEFDTIPDVILEGENVGDDFGRHIAYVGNMNGDGFGDIAVTAGHYNYAGKVYIYLGNTKIDTIPIWTTTSEGYFTYSKGWGTSLIGANINGDEYNDLIIGAIGGGGPSDSTSGGTIQIFLGGTIIDTIPDWEVYGKAGQTIGWHVASGDFNNDGFDDIIHSPTARYIYLSDNTMIDTIPSGITLYNPPNDPDAFGAALTCGDINNDGFDDIIVGAPTALWDVGRIYGFLGSTNIDTIPAIDIIGHAIGYFGDAVSSGGDVNGDGCDDILVGEWGYPSGAHDIGAASLYAGDSNIVVGITEDIVSEEIPIIFALEQNYPNPFNAYTTINYSLTDSGNTTLKIYNIKGELVKTLTYEYKEAGYYAINWSGDDENGNLLSSGIYFYKIETDTFTETKSMVMLK